MARIAVENSLQSVKEALQQSGHDVVSMEGGGLEGCDCCVISGQDKNVMGMAETATQASVINAQGMTAEEVLQQVNQRLQ
ncbi:YkuS family protein [Paenibacillus ginsengihumi]|uniref:YkuS family protein n=1 Tax=Paenibacillus ginsengihumi TaxID=431596 RepID=UPI00036C2515|nr:YkuS family protein [Paenibacillus ginsengihumi]